MAEPTGSIVFPTDDPQTKSKHSLVVLGVLLIALFVAGVVLARVWGSETKVTPSGTSGSSTATQTTTSKTLASDTLLTAVLASGAVLVLVGLLYSRISAIKLPGGGEIDLTPDEKQKVANSVADKVAKHEITPDQAPHVAVAATDELLKGKRLLGVTQVSNPVVELAVDKAKEAVT